MKHRYPPRGRPRPLELLSGGLLLGPGCRFRSLVGLHLLVRQECLRYQREEFQQQVSRFLEEGRTYE